MKRLLAILVVAALALCAAALAEASVGMANPWVEADAAAVEALLGVPFGVPEGAEDVRYAILETENLAEMDFTWYDMEYCARIMPADAYRDISGAFYETWDQSMDVEIGGWPGMDMRTPDGDVVVNVCLWYDADAGLMYSLMTSGEDLNGFDICAAADAIYAPAMQ